MLPNGEYPEIRDMHDFTCKKPEPCDLEDFDPRKMPEFVSEGMTLLVVVQNFNIMRISDGATFVKELFRCG
jgi:hypothetical protein